MSAAFPPLARAQYYTFTTNVSISWNSGFMSDGTDNGAIYVPEHVTEPKGVIFFWNGDGEDRRYMTTVGWFQQIARAMDYAIIALQSVYTKGYHILATQNTVTWTLENAAIASNRPVLRNAPVYAMGHSRGGIVSIRCAKHIPWRILAYAASKGYDWDYDNPDSPADPPFPPNYQLVPGFWMPGETDSNTIVNPFKVQQSFQTLWRNIGALAAYAVDYNVSHEDMSGQYHDFAALLLREAHALRHPGTPPSSTPGDWLQLGNLTFSSGWLAERAFFNNSTSDINSQCTQTVRPTWPQIAPVANFTGNASIASWLPNELMARVYRAHTSTQPTYVNRLEVPRQNPLQIETPARFQRFRTTDPVFISVDPREWADSTTITKMEFYLNTTKLGERTDGNWTWDAGTISTPGIHAVIVEAEGADGTRYAAYTAILVFDPLSSGNLTNTWTGNASSNNIQAGENWSAGNSTWQSITSGNITVLDTRQLFVLNGASRNNQATLSTGSASNDPAILGFRFLSANGTNPFTISGWRRIYLGAMGIVNLDNDQQVFNNAELFLNGSQIWDASAGNLLIGNGTLNKIRFGSRQSSLPRFIPEGSTLTITGSANTTINAPIDGNGALIKDGSGILIINSNCSNWTDSDQPWSPSSFHETLCVMRGTLRLGSNAVLNPRTRLLIANHPNATLEADGLKLTFATLQGGGSIHLGTGGNLTITHDFVRNSSNNSTIWFYPIAFNYRGSIHGGSPNNTTLFIQPGPNNLNTYRLGGNSTFAGQVQLSSGNLIISHTSALGASGTGNETFLPSGSVLFLLGNGMNIPETLSHNAANTVALINQRGNNTWSGPIHFSTRSGSPTVQIHNNGTNSTLTLSGGISGNATAGNSTFVQLQPNGIGSGIHVTGGLQNGTAGGNLRVVVAPNATGSWVRMSGVSNYTGATQHVRNTLLIGSDVPASGDGALGNSAGGTIFLGRSGHTVATDNIVFLTDGPVTIGRTLQVNNVNTGGNITVGGNSGHVSNYTGSITINETRTQIALTSASGGNVVISGQISGGASNMTLTKTGPGTLTLARAGGNTYNGSTTVAQGTLLVTNTSGTATGNGSVTVQNNARLGGTGTIAGAVTMQSGARLVFDLTTNASVHDRLDISGTLTLNNTAIDLTSTNNGIAAGNYTLVQAGSITGSPGSVVVPSGWNGTASVVGGNQLRVQIQQALTALEQWRQTHFGSPANSGDGADTADPDADGIPNLIEYALGGNPTSAASRPQPTVGTAVVSGQQRLTLTFTPQVVSGLTYLVQASNDLSDWSTQTDVTSSLTVGQPYTFTDSADLATTPRRFLRLRVTSN
ncbi:MAG: autotransporter-associated beta strand repeat-containing protein [Chthoniobacterales bacterium]|nr:autotransporter-associated beta strand repeat-containing protein [Chthoniobacterales bacterium]